MIVSPPRRGLAEVVATGEATGLVFVDEPAECFRLLAP
jgi:hypothetical protein